MIKFSELFLNRLWGRGECYKVIILFLEKHQQAKFQKGFSYKNQNYLIWIIFLIGLRQYERLNDSSLIGNLFENLTIAEILKRNHHQYQLHDYWFWRDSNAREIDLLTKRAGGFDIIEIKSTQTVLPKQFKQLDYFTEISKGKVKS